MIFFYNESKFKIIILLGKGRGARVSDCFTKNPNQKKVWGEGEWRGDRGSGSGCRWTDRRLFKFFEVWGISMKKCKS